MPGAPGSVVRGPRKYTAQQLEYLWINAGGPAAVAPIAAAIALAESNGMEIKQQGQPPDQTGWGPWQITPGNPNLLNGPTNAQAAVAKYKAAGNSFTPWTTFTSGKYKSYLPHQSLGGEILGGVFLGLLGGAAGAGALGAAGAAEGATAAEAGGATAAEAGAAGGAGGAATNLLGKLAGIKQGLGLAALIGVLLDPKHVLRILMVIGGLVLIIVSLVYMLKTQLLRSN